MKNLILLSLLGLQIACFQRNTVPLASLQLPATPPLKTAQRWAVVNQVALKMLTEAAKETEILALIPYAQLVEVQRIDYESANYWCKVRYNDKNDQVFEGWVSQNGLILFANFLEAEITSKRLNQNN